jgi:hypothetical protein
VSARQFQVGDRVVAYGRSGGQVATGAGAIDKMDEYELDGEAYVSVWVRLDTPVMDDGVERKWITLYLAADRATPHFDHTIELESAAEPVYLEIDGVVMKTTADAESLADLLDYGWEQITREEAMTWRPLDEDDGTEAESLAEVQAPAFPDVLVHGRSRVGAS